MTYNKDPQKTVLTGPHRLLHALLRQMGFEVENETPVGKYRLDCFVRECWVAFECDGKRIHAGVKKQAKDQTRDEWIYENAGIPVLRIQSDALQYTLWEELKPQILKFIDDYAETLEERKALGKGLVI